VLLDGNITDMDHIGRYRIIGELGRGAMGVVYHATDPAIGRSVAIKTIRIRDINDTQQRLKLRERLFREARSAGVLSHPNIVTIYDMDEIDGLAYIAMAYVNGPTLEKILAAQAPLSGAVMLRMLRQAASALDYAHARGIVHRDVKPANIMTDEDGAVKITDFGIAKITAVQNNLTETMMVVGTPNYMSPEQVQGLTVDGRSDQFSLAVVAYEILTGERPFSGDHLSTVVYRIVSEEPPEPQQINPTLTPQIDDVLRRGLAKNAADRFPNCSSFVGALEMACAESRGWTTLGAGVAPTLPTTSVEQPGPVSGAARYSPAIGHPDSAPAPEAKPGLRIDLPPPARRDEQPQRSSLLMPVLMAVLLVFGLGGIFAWQNGGIPGVFSFGDKRAPEPVQAKAPAAQAPAQPQQASQQPAPSGDAAQQPTEPQSQKPSPLGPTPEQPAPPPAASGTAPAGNVPGAASGAGQEPREVVKIPGAPVEDIWVTSNPPGAKAVLDDNINEACMTPCMLHGPTGVHHLTYSQAGYKNEYREIHVGETAMDAPLVTLRQPNGTLLLTTIPAGASIRVNGQPVPQTTPAQLNLAPGTYSVTVEKGGKSQTQNVEIHEDTVYMRIPLGQ
jgi:serine/threonine protein kinase